MHIKQPVEPTVHFQDEARILAAPRGVCHRDDIVARVLQSQVCQSHGPIGVCVHSVSIIHRHVGENPRLPDSYAPAHNPRHEGPLYCGDPKAGNIHREKHMVLHRPCQALLRRLYGEGTHCWCETIWLLLM